MNSHQETPDRDIARVLKKESHENTRRDRKQFRNIANELRYAESSDDLDDLDVDTFERFRRKWKHTVNILFRVTTQRPEPRIPIIPNSHVNLVANPIMLTFTIRTWSRERDYTSRERCRIRIHIADAQYAETTLLCIAQRVTDIPNFTWDYDFFRTPRLVRKTPTIR